MPEASRTARGDSAASPKIIRPQKSLFDGNPLLNGDPASPKKRSDVVLGLFAKRPQSKVLPQTAASVAAASMCLFTVVILLYLRWVTARMDRMVHFAKAVADGQLQERLKTRSMTSWVSFRTRYRR
jgi:hypothetical protein